MKEIKAFKKSFDYLDDIKSEKYLLFLKQHFINGNPTFYSVAAKTKVNTPDGIMYVIRLDLELANPNYEPIAEIWINGHFMYLWRDQCWAIAKDTNGNEILTYFDGVRFNRFNRVCEPCSKIIIIHNVGRDPVFEGSDE